MNLLFVQNSLAPFRGGIARVSYTLAQYFEKNGITCFYAFFNVDTDVMPSERKLKFQEDLPYDELKPLLTDFIEKNQIDIIIHQDQNDEKYAHFYAELRKTHHIIVIDCMHNLPNLYKYWHCGWKLQIKLWLYRIRNGYDYYAKEYHDLYAAVDKFLFLSKSFIPLGKRCYGLKDKKKLGAISNPLPFERTTPVDFGKKKNQFLIVTRLDDFQKNLMSALRIWKLFEGRNSDYELVMAGYGQDEKQILDYAKELNLQRFRFIGRSTNPIPFYEESKYFMMTSRFEGFGMTLVEAQQCGCIPFAFDTYSALHDIVENEKSGFIIPKNNEKAYAEKMYHAVTYENMMATVAMNAFESSKKFSVENIGKEWLALFEELKQ